MHILTAIFTIICAWRWGDWKNWQKYHATMIFFAMGNLLYNFLYCDHLLWQFKPDFIVYHVNAEILSTFIILPLTGLIFLSNHPNTVKGEFYRTIKFITIFFLFEVVYSRCGILVYNNGWNIWWSLAWLCMMFPMLLLHHKKPLIAYVASTIVGIILVIFFPISFK